jgi:hypothetical protein
MIGLVRIPVSLFAVAGLLGCALVAASCGSGGPSSSPTVPLVSVEPTPTPSTDTPGVEAETSSCPLGPGTVNTSCSSNKGSLHLADVQTAIDRQVRVRPELFDLEDESGSGQYRVLDREAYLEAIVDDLRAAGFCAQRAYDRETIQVKGSNDLSEDFDVITSSGYVRRNAYLATCRPAAFPVEPADLIARVRVAFWGFECNPGVEVPSTLARVLPRGCDGSVTATPKDKDGVDVPLAVHGPEIEWELRRGDEVVNVLPDKRFPNPFNLVLRPKGPLGAFHLCATVQGVEGCLAGTVVP